MTSFTVRTQSHFESLARPLRKHHRDFDSYFRRALEILKEDPHNLTRSHPIRKLSDVKPGDGQYRIRAGRFRFRYDIEGQTVYLKACSLRREDTYR